MRIRELRLIRYGKFTERTLSLPAASQDIHLIVGLNEAGKSTVRQAISDWLFGIPTRTTLGFLHPMPQLRLGGVIEASRPAQLDIEPGKQAAQQQQPEMQALDFERVKGQKNTLRSAQDEILPPAVLQPWLGNLQADTFNRMHALDHARLIEGGDSILSASDDIGRMLFQSAAGIEHLGDALSLLEEQADALWGPRKKDSRVYYRALDEHTRATRTLKDAQLHTRDWKARHDELAQTEQALSDARARHGDIARQQSRLERLRRVRPMLLALDEASARLEALAAAGMPTLLPEDAGRIVAQARRDAAVVESDIRRLQTALKEHAEAREKLPIDREILAVADEVMALNERRVQYREHPRRLQERREAERALWSQVQQLVRELGWPDETREALLARLPAAPQRSRLAKLMTRHTELRRALDETADRRDVAQKTLQHDRQRLAELDAIRIDARLHALVEQAGTPGNHAAALADLDAQLDELDQRIESALQAMGNWRQDAAALQRMLVPEHEQVQERILRLGDDEQELATREQALEARQQEARLLEQSLQQLVRDHQPVSREQLQQARISRDELWDAIKASPESLPGRTQAFEQQMHHADELADARLERVAHETERLEKTARLEKYGAETNALKQQIQRIQTRIAAQHEEWQELANACGLPGLPLRQVPVWLRQRERALELIAQRASVARKREVHLARAQTMLRELSALLNASLGEERLPEAADLAACLRRAQQLIRQADQGEGVRAELHAQIHQGEERLLSLESAQQAAQREWAQWESSWQQALQAAGMDSAVSVDEAEQRLGLIAEIQQRVNEMQAIRRDGIEALEHELTGLAEDARKLAEVVMPQLREQEPDEIVLTLFRRLEGARQADAQAAALKRRQDDEQAMLVQAQQRQLAIDAALAPLQQTAGVREFEALEIAIERSMQRRRLEAERDAAHRALIQNADGVPIEGLREEAAAIDPDALKVQLEALSDQAEKLVEEIAVLSARHGTQKSAFEALDGSDAAIRAAARQQEAVSTMTDAAERYLRLQTAARLLRWSIERYRETRQGPMLGRASEIFAALTMGSFARLLVDNTERTPQLLGVRTDGAQVAVRGMSEGTRDQLYLALRLASLDLQAAQGTVMPLIVDDLFINFDDRRTEAGLKVLGELSGRMQIIFLTHHDHLLPLAQRVLGKDLNLIML